MKLDARPLLETIVQAELYLPVRRAYRVSGIGDIAEARVRYVAVGKLVAGDVESIKEIGSETDSVFVPYMDILEQGQVDLTETWSTFGTVARSTERVR